MSFLLVVPLGVYGLLARFILCYLLWCWSPRSPPRLQFTNKSQKDFRRNWQFATLWELGWKVVSKRSLIQLQTNLCWCSSKLGWVQQPFFLKQVRLAVWISWVSDSKGFHHILNFCPNRPQCRIIKQILSFWMVLFVRVLFTHWDDHPCPE